MNDPEFYRCWRLFLDLTGGHRPNVKFADAMNREAHCMTSTIVYIWPRTWPYVSAAFSLPGDGPDGPVSRFVRAVQNAEKRL